ncbi:MAG: ferredoxin, partial [Bacteroidaceae bacterium]|nr:ferredoxin [Bacteroidaceae bacterium]
KCPLLDISLCQDCKMCVKLGPTNAIDPLTLDTDSEKCIKCCACVKGCVFHARFMPTPFAPLISENFSIQKENKILL